MAKMLECNLPDKLFLIKPILGDWTPSIQKIQKGASRYCLIMHWSQKTYALLYIQTRTRVTVYKISNTHHCQTHSHRSWRFCSHQKMLFKCK